MSCTSSSPSLSSSFVSPRQCLLHPFTAYEQRTLPSHSYGHYIAFDPNTSRRHKLSIRTSSRRVIRPVYANSLGPTCEEDEWIQKLPEKKKPLYSHSLPCIEAWLKTLGFIQTKEDRATWTIERSDWHARLSLDVTDLFIRLVCQISR